MQQWQIIEQNLYLFIFVNAQKQNLVYVWQCCFSHIYGTLVGREVTSDLNFQGMELFLKKSTREYMDSSKYYRNLKKK